MIEPDKSKESEDINVHIASFILEILEVGDSKSIEFKKKINYLYDRLRHLVRRNVVLQEFGLDKYGKTYSNDKAISFFEFGLKFLPEHLDFLKYYSAFSYQRNYFGRAVPYLKKIVELEPDSCYGWNFLGFSIYNSGNSLESEKYGDPETCYKKALELDETYQEAWVNLGLFYKREKRFEEAINCLEKAIALDDKDDFALFLLGHVYQIIGNGELAIECYNKSIDLNPCNDSLWNNLGLEHAKRFEFKKAIQMYVRALQFNAKNEVIWHNLRYAYLGTEEFEKADYCENKSRNLSPFSPDLGREVIIKNQHKEKEIWNYYS